MDHSDIEAHAIKTVAYSQDVTQRMLHSNILSTELSMVGEPNPEEVIASLVDHNIIGVSKYGFVYMKDAGREELNILENQENG